MKIFFPRHKVPLAEKMLFWRPCRSKVSQRSGKFSLKVRKKFWKKSIEENFFSLEVLGTRRRKVFQPLYWFFQKSRHFHSKSELTYEKKTRKQFFLRNCLWTHKIFYLKSCHFFMEIAQKFTQSLRKTIKITCFLKTCVFPQNFPPDSQNAFLTNLPEKTYQNCENIGLRVQKKLRN